MHSAVHWGAAKQLGIVMSTGKLRYFKRATAAFAIMSSVAVITPQVALTGAAGGAALVGASVLASTPAEAQPNKRICGSLYQAAGHKLAIIMEVNKADIVACTGFTVGLSLTWLVASRLDIAFSVLSQLRSVSAGSVWFLKTCEAVTRITGGGYRGDICNSMVDYKVYARITYPTGGGRLVRKT